MMTTSKKTILTAITAAPLLALGRGLAYANTGSGTPPAPAVTTATTAHTATPAPAPGTGQHPAAGTCRNGTWHYNDGRWCCDTTHAGYQNPATQHQPSQGNGQYGYQQASHQGHDDGCRDR